MRRGRGRGKAAVAGALTAAISVFLLLSGCTLSDSLRQDEIRSVWQRTDQPGQDAEVFFVTDREPAAKAFGLHWGAALSCGKARFLMPNALSNAGARMPPPSLMDCDDAASLRNFLRIVRDSGRARDCSRILLIIPGYNTTFTSALLRAGQVAADTSWTCPAILFSWSSEGKFDRYAADIERSSYSVPHLIGLLREIHGLDLEAEIFSQSMGGRIALGAITALCTRRDPLVGQLILAAPDVSAEHDNDDFGKFLKRISPCVTRTTVYASDNDLALITSESFHGGVPRAGRVPERNMQYVRSSYGDNIDAIDTSLAPADEFGHGYFVLSYEMMADMMGVFAGTPIEQRALMGQGNTLTCPGSDPSRCVQGKESFVLTVAKDRRPGLKLYLKRWIWPIFLPIQ